MNGVLTVGPLAIPLSLLLLVAVAAVSLVIGKRVGQRLGVDAETTLLQALLIGLVIARLGFVYEFRTAYFDAPLSILDLRDGGWSPVAGFVGAWLFAIRRMLKRPALKKPVHWAMWTGSALWMVGAAALAMQPQTGQKLPPLELPTLAGASLRLDDFIGKPTVVNLWATWCPPCAREMPMLHRAQADRPEINFVFLNQGESAQTVGDWLAQRKLPLRNVVLDGRGRAGAAFGHSAYPTTLFFDAAGRLVATRIGELSSATLAQKLEPLAH